MPVSVIPSLSLAKDQITDPREQIAYLLRHAANNPGWTSSYLEPYLISMRKLYSENHENVGDMVSSLQGRLQYSLDQLHPGSYTVNVTVTDMDTLTVAIAIAITDRYGNVVVSTDDIRVSENKIYLKGEPDHAN